MLHEVITRATGDESFLIGWLRAAHQAGRLSVPDPELAAHMFSQMTAGVLFWPQLLKGRMDSATRERLTHELVATFLARYRSAPG